VSETRAMIRRATIADLPAICDLAQDLNALHHAAWPNLFAAPAQPSIDIAHWRQSIDGKDQAAFVALEEGATVAFLSMTVATDRHSLLQTVRFARVNSVCVAPALRGRGIGHALMAAAEEWGRKQGAADMRLVVWSFNQDAIRLYEELGYAIRSHTMGKPLQRMP
jgi:ribosomal protein S18 acetylase RimI-like enzyme